MKEEKAWWDHAGRSRDTLQVAVWPEGELGLSGEGVKACADLIVPYLRKGVIVDLGCGYGRLTVPVAEATNSFTIGLDVSGVILSRARRAPHVAYVQGDGYTIPLGDESVDSVYSMVMFQHIPPEATRGYISEIGRCLRPDGVARLQCVEGVQDTFLGHHLRLGHVAYWCNEASLDIERISHDLHPAWAWITARKR